MSGPTRLPPCALALALAIAVPAFWGPRALAAPTPPPITSIDLPTPNEAFPGGPEAEAARRDCLTCHSSDYIYTQPRLTKAQWTAEVTKMVKAYGAPIPDGDVSAIVSYLVAQNGTP